MQTLVGRDAELASVASWLDAPSARTLLIEGEAGIGKTTVWHAAIEEAQARGFRAITCSAAQAETQLSFTALRDLLQGAFARVADLLPDPQRRTLAVMLLLEEPRGAPPERGALGVSLLGALRALAHESPTVVAIDDTQWLDPASVAALEYALRRLDSGVVVVVLARRVGEAGSGAIVDSLGDGVERIVLDALTIGALGRVLHERLGRAFPRPTLHRLHQVSGGNPFFALELARSLEGAGSSVRPGEPLPVPSTQIELVRKRLGALPADTLDALSYASALSQPTIALVNAALEGDARTALEAAARADVARAEGSEVRFTHPLFAAATYELVASRRRPLHARLAAVVSDPEERARHLALATDEPDERVARIIEEGAQLAFGRGSPAAAAELTEEALRLTPVADVYTRSRRADDAGWYHFTAGDAARARTLLEAAIATAAPGNHRARAVLRLATIDHHARDRRAALADLERITRDDTVDDLEIKAEAKVLVAVSYWVLHEDIPLAARHAHEAVEVCERLGDPALLVSALAALGMCEFTLGGGLPSSALERALGIKAEASDRRILRQPFQHSAATLLCADRFDEARTLLLRVHGLGEDHGDASVLPWPLMRLAQLELLAGDWPQAEKYAETGLDAALQTGQAPLQADLLCTRALILAHLGRVEEARATAEEGLVLAERSGAGIGLRVAQWALGLLDVGLANYESAAARLEPLRLASRAAGVVDPGENRYLGDLGESLVALGRTDEADELADELHALGVSLERPAAVAVASRVRGLAALERGEKEAALDAFERALVRQALVPMPFERARMLLALGTAQRRSRQRRAARETLQTALATFRGLGAHLWAEMAQTELGRIGGRVSSGSGLTPTEQRVADLVSEGMSNKEAAAVLVVSVHTVEAALTSIYRKLDVRSRTEMAAKLTESA